MTNQTLVSLITNTKIHANSRTPEAGPLLLKIILNRFRASLLIYPLCKSLFGLNVVQAHKLEGFESYHAFLILQVIQSMFTVVGQPLCIPTHESASLVTSQCCDLLDGLYSIST
jgi:hypothetical protein